MTEVAANPIHPSSGPSASRSLPLPTPTSAHSVGSLHAMSTRSSDAVSRRQSVTHLSQQQPQPQQQSPEASASSGPPIRAHPSEAHRLPPVEGRLTRKRARSINVEEANHPRVDQLSLYSPAVSGTPPSSASTVSNSDLICICPSPPKVPRPRNAFILYRQHHQAGVVLKYPGLANPDISKIIGEHWREEDEDTKNYWKRLAEEEKARHQRQFPQYKYQPRRGGKGGAAARAASAAGEGGDPGRCPKCGGRYIATPRTPSTPFSGMPGPGHGSLGGGPASMQPFITNNPRVIETVHHQQQHHPHYTHHPHQRLSVDAQHGGGGGGMDPRRQSSYYPHPPESMRTMDEDYDGGPASSLSRRRGPQHDDYDMALTSPDVKRRRFGPYDRSPERGSPMSAVSQHHHQLHQGQQPYHSSVSAQHQQPYTPHLQQQQHPDALRSSGRGPVVYTSQPGSSSSSYQMAAPLPRPHESIGGGGGPRGPAPPHHPPPPPQQQQQQREMNMAPPPRPSRLSTASGTGAGVPPPPPGLPAPPRTGGGGGGPSSFDESLTLAPLQIPSSPGAQLSEAASTGGAVRSLSSGGGGPGGPGGPVMASQMTHQQHHPPPPQQQETMSSTAVPRGGGGGADSQARGVEAMVMSIPYMNKLDVLRKISPPLGAPGPGSPVAETRGPVIAIEGPSAALLREVRPVLERALRASGECDLRVWADSSVERASPTPDPGPGHSPPAEGGGAGGAVGSREDVGMSDAQEKMTTSSSSLTGGSRAGSVSAGSDTPVPRRVSGHSNNNSGGSPTSLTGTRDYLLTILEWDSKSSEIVKHVITRPTIAASTSASTSSPSSTNPSSSAAEAEEAPPPAVSSTTAAAATRLTPVALIAGGFSLTLSDRFASTVAITDPYSPVDHWQWMATLWRGIVGADLVVYVTAAEETAAARGGSVGAVGVEYRAPGVMVVRVAGDRVDEKTERRLAFEVMEWVRAGSFRDGYMFDGEGGN